VFLNNLCKRPAADKREVSQGPISLGPCLKERQFLFEKRIFLEKNAYIIKKIQIFLTKNFLTQEMWKFPFMQSVQVRIKSLIIYTVAYFDRPRITVVLQIFRRIKFSAKKSSALTRAAVESRIITFRDRDLSKYFETKFETLTLQRDRKLAENL